MIPLLYGAEALPLAWLELLRFSPWWLQGALAKDLMRAVGARIDDVDRLGVQDQLFILDAYPWGLSYDVLADDGVTQIPVGWEPDYGIPTIATDDVATRRRRVLAKRRGQVLRNDADFLGYVRALLLPAPTADADARVHPGQYVVYILHDEGWLANFADVEAALALAGPSHLGLWLAPHDVIHGLTAAQVNQMHAAAVNALTPLQLDGP